MITKSIKKILSSGLIATYLIAYAAPIGFCAEAASKLKAEVNKPALRTAPASTSLKLEGDISLTKGNPKISLSLRDSDVKQVLRMFADKAGLNIIFHDSASGKVTLDLVNVPLNDAFKMVMQVTNLTYFVDGNTMIVASSAAAQSLNMAKQEMMVVPVKYANASVMADFLNKNIFSLNKPGLSSAQIAVTNPSTNEILIFGTKNDYLMAKKVVSQFDKKPLEQTFVVNHSTPKEMSNLICSVLLKAGSAGSSSSSSSSSTSSSSSSSSSSGSSSSGGSETGGAAESSGSSSSDSLSLGQGVFACEYNASLSAGSLSSLGTTSLTVTYFPQRGTINVFGGSVQQMEMIKEFIAKNDKKQPQAYLEVSIIELSESGSREFSNTWQVWSEYFSASFDGATSTNPLYPTFIKGDGYAVVDPEDPSTVLYNIAKYSGSPMITYAINYLIKNGKGRVLSNPRILITNGQASSIDLSSDYVKTVKSEVLSNAGGLAGAVQRTYEIGSDEGIKVNITPFISPEDYVTLNIKPEYSTIKEQIYVPTVINGKTVNDLMATLLQRRNLDLKSVRIKDGETLIIGGMIREVETKGVSKIPVLGDLPAVGMFFRNTSSSKERQELIIMITPKIVKDTEDVINNAGATL